VVPKKNHLAKNTQETVVAVVSNISQLAVDDELIQVNPFTKEGKYCTENGNGTKEANPFSPEEASQFMKETADLSYQNFAYFALNLYTGMRRGEHTRQVDELDGIFFGT
jgi:hypothetical protein